MAAMLGKFVSKKLLGETLENKFGKEDPYFETVPATRLDGRPSSKKVVKRRKALPLGLSEHDGKILTKVKRRAYHLDMSLFHCCGIRFGWSSVIGIVPVIGDALDAFMAMMVFRTCMQVEGGLPADVKSKMAFNIALDFAVGLVPFLGDIADALFRANTRNAVVLEEYLRKKGAKNLLAQGRRVPTLDPSDPDEFDRQERSPPPEYATSPPTRQSSRAQGGGHITKGQPGSPRQPGNGNSPRQQQARHDQVPVREESGGGGFFGFGSKKNKQVDPERGMDMGRSQNNSQDIPTRQKSTLQKNRY